MDQSELAERIDHTVLGPTTTQTDVIEVLDQALTYGMNACIPPCYVRQANEYAPTVPLVTVIGFPHGQHSTEAKREEAVIAWNDGADELDVMINIGLVKNNETDRVVADLEEVIASVPIPVKVIVEAGLLTEDEKQRACKAAVTADAAFLKTATGFADSETNFEDVELLSKYLPVKAAGGIDSWNDVRAMLNAGAARIGTSSGVTIMNEFPEDDE